MECRASTCRLTVVFMHSFTVLALLPSVASSAEVGPAGRREDAQTDPLPRGYTIPLVDLSTQTERQVVVDHEPGQYVVSVRLKLDELDRLTKSQAGGAGTAPQWLPGQEHKFDGYKVTLSRPALVGRSKGYLWFPSLSQLSDGKLLAVMTDYADVHAKISTARLAWSRDGG